MHRLAGRGGGHPAPAGRKPIAKPGNHPSASAIDASLPVARTAAATPPAGAPRK